MRAAGQLRFLLGRRIHTCLSAVTYVASTPRAGIYRHGVRMCPQAGTEGSAGRVELEGQSARLLAARQAKLRADLRCRRCGVAERRRHSLTRGARLGTHRLHRVTLSNNQNILNCRSTVGTTCQYVRHYLTAIAFSVAKRRPGIEPGRSAPAPISYAGIEPAAPAFLGGTTPRHQKLISLSELTVGRLDAPVPGEPQRAISP